MTADDYRRLEHYLAMAEEFTEDRPLGTSKGREIRDELHALLQKVTLERIRAEAALELLKDRDTKSGML